MVSVGVLESAGPATACPNATAQSPSARTFSTAKPGPNTGFGGANDSIAPASPGGALLGNALAETAHGGAVGPAAARLCAGSGEAVPPNGWSANTPIIAATTT